MSQLVVMLYLGFCQRDTRLVLFLALPFIWRSAIGMYASNALVSAVSYGFGVLIEVYPGILEQSEVMSFSWSKVGTQYFLVLLTDDYLAFGRMTLLFARVVPPLSFFGRSTGDSEASTRATSMIVFDLTRDFLPGKANCLSLMRVFSTQRLIYQAVLSPTP